MSTNNRGLRTLPFHENVLRLLGRFLISLKSPKQRRAEEDANFKHWRKRYLHFLADRVVERLLEDVGRWVAGTRIPTKHREEVVEILKRVYEVMPEDRAALAAMKSALHSLGVKRMPSRASKE